MPMLDTARRAADLLRPVAALATRLVLGQLFLLAGTGKLGNLEARARDFAKLGLDFPSAEAFTGFIGVCETVGGALLILGLGTRFAALVLSGVMVGALATAHEAEFLGALVLKPEEGTKSLTEIVAFVVLLLLLWLLAFGAGLFSVDRVLARRRTARLVVPPA